MASAVPVMASDDDVWVRYKSNSMSRILKAFKRLSVLPNLTIDIRPLSRHKILQKYL